MPKKIAFIIPGFGCPTRNKEYQEIAGFFKRKKFKVVFVEITWKRNTHKEYVEQFKTQYLKHVSSGDEICVLGFSFGAMISCIVAPELKPQTQILCSLSPYFKEDMPFIRNWWKTYHGKNRCRIFETLSFSQIAKNTKSKTIIFAGTEEGIEVERRAKDTKKKIKNSELIFIKDVKHDIADKRYLEKIKEAIYKFL